jgi:hypothetical protein
MSLTSSSLSSALTHINYVVALGKVLYSASALDCDIVLYFIALHGTKLGPINIAKPSDRLSSRQPAQYAFEKAVRRLEEDCVKVMLTCKYL